MERLSFLLTDRFFPEDRNILDRAALLDLAISHWIVTRGTASCDTPPLRYGEALVVTLPWSDGKVIQPGTVLLGDAQITDIEFPVRNGLPALDLGATAALRLESLDGRRAKAAILAGDMLRIKLIPGNSYLGAPWHGR